MHFLDGKKTYLVAAATILWGWSGVALGQHDVATAINLTLAAAAAFGFRAAMTR